VEEIRIMLGADSLHYLSLAGLARSVARPDHYCLACLTGSYPVPFATGGGKQ
jgi:amidophosphoribosyltransferase